MARRLLANHHRSTRRRLALVRRIALEPPQTVGTRTVDDHRVFAALQQLNESDRELVLLVGWEELTPAQAAVVLDVAAATARTRLHRARQRLLAALESMEGSA